MKPGEGHLQRLGAPRAVAALAVATLATLALLAISQSVEPASAGANCSHAESTIDEATGRQLRRAVICLINDDRADHDRHRLDSNSKLQAAATKHTKTMFRKNCWKHQCPGEPSFEKRIRNTGYIDGARRWRFAENFGCDVTPKAMVNTWLDFDFPRENIRNRAFRDIGLGVLKKQVGKSACDDGDEVTYTVVFGRRKG